MLVFSLKFHRILLINLRVQLTLNHWLFRSWLGTQQEASHHLNNYWPISQTHERVASFQNVLIHWGRVKHICIGKLTTISSDDDLSGWRQAIICTNAGILLIGPLGTNFSEILITIQIFSLNKIHLKISSAKYCSFCLGLNVLSRCLLVPLMTPITDTIWLH